jgi:hypothetical protein
MAAVIAGAAKAGTAATAKTTLLSKIGTTLAAAGGKIGTTLAAAGGGSKIIGGLNVASGLMGVAGALKPGDPGQAQSLSFQSQRVAGRGQMIDPSSGQVRVKTFADYFKEGASDVQ